MIKFCTVSQNLQSFLDLITSAFNFCHKFTNDATLTFFRKVSKCQFCTSFTNTNTQMVIWKQNWLFPSEWTFKTAFRRYYGQFWCQRLFRIARLIVLQFVSSFWHWKHPYLINGRLNKPTGCFKKKEPGKETFVLKSKFSVWA